MILEVNNLVKKIGCNVILENISFKIEGDSIIGLYGKNGSGKTTLFRVLLELCKYNSGSLLNNSQKRKMIFDTPPDLGDQKVIEYLNYFSNLYQGTTMNKTERIRLLERINLMKYEKRRVSEISFGMKKILYLSTLLIGTAELIIVDEPFNGLDTDTIEIAKEIILECKRYQSASIIVSSHLLSELEDICDGFMKLDNHTITYTSTLEKSLVNLRVSFADFQLLVSSIGDLCRRIEQVNSNYIDIIVNEDITSYDVAKKLVLDDVNFGEIFYRRIPFSLNKNA